LKSSRRGGLPVEKERHPGKRVHCVANNPQGFKILSLLLLPSQKVRGKT